MATYNQIGYGSKGSDVIELQKLLKQNGYTLDEDGIFGANTQTAVKDYQQKNGLTADGIVGQNTWGVLTKAGTSQLETPADPPKDTTPSGFEHQAYTPSDTVVQAETLLQQHLANKPGEYQSPWQDQLNELFNRINNREDFSYDLNGDALYQQYKDQYVTQGNMAMMDTMGQAAAMTGGYGNSYAQSVGQQTYQGYLQGLNDKIPELYQLALNQYNAEGDEMYNQFALMSGLEDQEYGRYRDSVSDFYTELGRLTDAYNTERDYDYSQWYNNLMYQYQTGRDQVADEQWKQEFDFAVDQSRSSGGGGGTGGSGDEETYLPPEGWDTARIKAFQKSSGLIVDGIWGPKTQAVYEKLNGNKEPTKLTYDDIVAEANEFIKSGASKNEISAYLRERLNEGDITQAEYNNLQEQFVPRGNTY